MRVRSSLLPTLAALLVAPSALAAPGDSIDEAIDVQLDAPLTVASDGGDVWFRYRHDGPDRVLRADLTGSTFDTTLGYTTANPLGRPLPIDAGQDDPLPAAHEALWAYVFGGGHMTWWRVSAAEPGARGDIRFLLSSTPADADRWATPAGLDVAGSAVSSVSRALVDTALEPGEPGGPQEGWSLWWRFVSPVSGPLELDACQDAQADERHVLRVLDDRPLGEARVLAEASGPCPRVTLQAIAGSAYRVQATLVGSASTRSVALRALTAGSPPAATFLESRCSFDDGGHRCVRPVAVSAAPGVPVVGVDCRLDGSAWAPCVPAEDGTWRTPAFDGGAVGRADLAVRATGADGRSAIVKSTVRFARIQQAPQPALAPVTPQPRALPAVRARFTRRGRISRVRAVVVRAAWPGLRVEARCGRGRVHSGTAPAAGRMRLVPRPCRLRPGARFAIRITAPDGRSRTVRWTARADRLPRRSARS